MERYLVFENVRKRIFPPQWYKRVAQSFPSLHVLINSMLSDIPSERPSADAVADSIEALLAEYTVQSLSLDRLTSQRREGSLLLRVEAMDVEGILPRTVKIIKESSPSVEIVQYGLRGQKSKAIMEFAISVPAIDEMNNGTSGDNGNASSSPVDSVLDSDAVNRIFTALRANKDIMVVRRVTEKHHAVGRNENREISH